MLGVLAVAVLAGAGVWYFMSSSASDTMVPNDQTATTTTSGTNNTTGGRSDQTVSGAGTTSGTGTITSLLALNKNLQCSVSISTGGQQTEGMVYLSVGNKIRGDFSTTQDGNAVQTSMINDGTYVYSWSNLSTQGFKETVAASGPTGAGAHGGVDSSASLTYSCKAWSPVSSKFVAPSNIKF